MSLKKVRFTKTELFSCSNVVFNLMKPNIRPTFARAIK